MESDGESDSDLYEEAGLYDDGEILQEEDHFQVALFFFFSFQN